MYDTIFSDFLSELDVDVYKRQIYADPDDGGRAVLHFELRKERQKLNPTLWVK